MEEALNNALNLLDKAVAIIQELMAQKDNKQKETKDDVTKTAEEVAVKTGLSIEDASAIIKSASDFKDADSLVKIANTLKKSFNTSFGKVAFEEKELSKTASADEKFKNAEAELMAELNLS